MKRNAPLERRTGLKRGPGPARKPRFGWDYWGDQSLGTAEMPEAAA